MQGNELLIKHSLVSLTILQADGRQAKLGVLPQFVSIVQQTPTGTVKVDDHGMLPNGLGQDREAIDSATAERLESELHSLEWVAGFGPHDGRDKTHQQEQGYAKSNWPRTNAGNTTG
jgi:hypothetical protein